MSRPKVDLISTAEASEILHRNQRSVLRYITDGLLVPAYTMPNTNVYLLDREEVDELAATLREEDRLAVQKKAEQDAHNRRKRDMRRAENQ